MAKGETKKTNEMLQQQRDAQAATYNPIINQQQGASVNSQGNTNQLYGDLYGAYSGMANGTGPGSGGSGYSAPQYTLTDYGQSKGVYDNAITSGLINDDDKARMRGSGVFDEFAKTGGYSDQDIANMRARAASSTPAFYDNLKRSVDQQNRITGGSGMGGQALAAQMARDQSRGVAESNLNNETAMRGAINSGRQWGAENASGSENSLQNLVTGNMKWGTEGVKSIAEAQAAEANRQAEANAAAANSSSSAANASRMQGLGGLEDLYNSQMGAQNMYTSNALAGANSMYGLGNDQLNMRYNAQGNNTSVGQQIASTAVGALGAMSGLGTVGAVSGMLKKKPAA